MRKFGLHMLLDVNFKDTSNQILRFIASYAYSYIFLYSLLGTYRNQRPPHSSKGAYLMMERLHCTETVTKNWKDIMGSLFDKGCRHTIPFYVMRNENFSVLEIEMAKCKQKRLTHVINALTIKGGYYQNIVKLN